MKQSFVGSNQEGYYDIMEWLNGLVGSDYNPSLFPQKRQEKIVRIIHWQIIPTGRPYEFSAVAQVEIEETTR